jgi:hypothetical protein
MNPQPIQTTGLEDAGYRLAALRDFKEGAICQLHDCRICVVSTDNAGCQVGFTVDLGDARPYVGNLIVKARVAEVKAWLQRLHGRFCATVRLAISERYVGANGDCVIPLYLRGDLMACDACLADARPPPW